MDAGQWIPRDAIGSEVSIGTNCHQKHGFKKVPDVLVSCKRTYIYLVPKKREVGGRKEGRERGRVREQGEEIEGKGKNSISYIKECIFLIQLHTSK